MKSLGMTVEETGIINGVSSTTAIFAPFLLGLIADKIVNLKVVTFRSSLKCSKIYFFQTLDAGDDERIDDNCDCHYASFLTRSNRRKTYHVSSQHDLGNGMSL